MATRNGTPGNDTLTGTQFTDSIFGFAGNDILRGLGSNDALDGGIGIDTLDGGAGNDTYTVDSTTDTIIEAANSGTDTVQSSVSYTLSSNLENLTLLEGSTGTGNSLNNSITGNGADNILRGEAGNDILYGGADDNGFGGGNDILYGGDGDDTLLSDSKYSRYGFYTSVMYGGDGNDTYIISVKNEDPYNPLSNGDTIIEAANSGIDTVQYSGGTYTGGYRLGSNLENLTLIGGASRGTGNSLDNKIVGSSGDNTLTGAGGNDILLGNSGSISERDTLTGGAGRDTFLLGDITQVFYDDRNKATAGRGDYALITDFNTSQDLIKLNGRSSDYRLASSPAGLSTGTAIYRNQPTSKPDELVAIFQGSTGLNLNSNYFQFNFDEFNLSTLNGSNGFVIKGIDANDYSGTSVSLAGDVNGDGFSDIIIGAPSANPNGQYSAGESYVVFGKAGGFGASLSLSTLNGSNGFVINGINASDDSGTSVSLAGDVNGDGFSDIIVGAPSNGQGSAGESYVVFGKTGGFGASLNLSTLNGSNGFVINGIDVNDSSGTSVSLAGDVNGDGFSDIIIGAPGADPYGQSSAGESYVVFGKAGGFGASLNLSTLNGSNGFVINGIDVNDSSGYSISTAGDVNGDGLSDIIIGAPGAALYGRSSASDSYVVFGKARGFGASLNLSTLNGSNGFVIKDTNDFLDASVSSAGDANGDGFDDLIISAIGAGESYVVFGKAEGFGAKLNLSTLNGSNGFKINGFDNYNYSRILVSEAGDVNGDGFDDLIIGVAGADINNQYRAGESYVVFGKAGGFGASLNLSTLNGSNGFVINGINTSDFSGSSVSSAGDVNGDGFDDLMVGARGAAPNSQNSAGESYLIFGRDFTNSVTNSGTDSNDTLTGTASNEILIGGKGNDRLIGGLGSDVLKGGAGNDIISYGITDRRSKGGSGTDTLRIDFSDNIDLTTLPNNKFTQFELIDITGTGNNSLTFNRLDVLNLSDTTNQLIVNGNTGDRATSTGQGWVFRNTTILNGIEYDRYTVGAATLLIDADITQIIT